MMPSVQRFQVNGRQKLNKLTATKDLILKIGLSVSMLSLIAIYLRKSSSNLMDAVTYFKVTVLDNKSFGEIITGLVAPGENGYFTSLFDLLLVKPLSFFIKIEWAFQVVNICTFVALGFLFFRLTSRFLKKTYAIFLTLLLLSTPSTGSFHTALFQISDRPFGLSNIYFLENSTASRIVFALLFFFSVRTFNEITKKQNKNVLWLTLILVHLIHPISGAICLFSIILMKYKADSSCIKTFKEKPAMVLLFISLIFSQVNSIIHNSQENYNSILGGFGGRATLDYSFYAFVLYLALPLLLLHISTKVINVSWYEIRSRFNFLLVPVLVQFFMVVIYILGWQNPLDILNRNGLVILVNILSYVPLLYVLSQSSRANKLVFIRLREGSRFIRILDTAPQVVTVFLIGAIFLQVSNSFLLREPLVVKNCAFLNGESTKELDNLIMHSVEDGELSIFEDTLSFVQLNLNQSQRQDFLANPLILGASLGSWNTKCRFIGLGYLLLNGFDQTDSAKNRIDAFNRILDSERKSKDAS
jgi:hypothetical protein